MIKETFFKKTLSNWVHPFTLDDGHIQMLVSRGVGAAFKNTASPESNISARTLTHTLFTRTTKSEEKREIIIS